MSNDLIVAVAAAVAAAAGSLLSRWIDLYFGKRGLGTTNAELLKTLQEANRARADRIAQLEEELRQARERQREAEERAKRLELVLAKCLRRLADVNT